MARCDVMGAVEVEGNDVRPVRDFWVSVAWWNGKEGERGKKARRPVI